VRSLHIDHWASDAHRLPGFAEEDKGAKFMFPDPFNALLDLQQAL
jgi:hypothetical protein